MAGIAILPASQRGRLKMVVTRLTLLSLLRRYATTYVALVVLAVICTSWSLIALPAYFVLTRSRGAALGRQGIMRSCRAYVWTLRFLRAYRLDLTGLEPLREESGIILAPNHPHLIDALLLLTINPNIVCILKSQLLNNAFLGTGSRLARYIRNDVPRRMIIDSVTALKDGSVLLLFPEGTRTVHFPINELQLTVGTIAKHAHVAVQTLLIETDSPYSSKGWPLFRVPNLPISYRIRLGRRFNAPSDVRRFTVELADYFAEELAGSPLGAWLPARGSDRIG